MPRVCYGRSSLKQLCCVACLGRPAVRPPFRTTLAELVQVPTVKPDRAATLRKSGRLGFIARTRTSARHANTINTTLTRTETSPLPKVPVLVYQAELCMDEVC